MSEKCPSCGSCGMPMEKPEQFGANDTSNAYCVHCTNDKGELFDYDTILKGNIQFYMEDQGLDEAAAKEYSIKYLSTLPV